MNPINCIALLLATGLSLSAGSARISCDVPANVARLVLFIGPGATNANPFQVARTNVAQTVTNLLTGIPVGTNRISATVVTQDGVSSDRSAEVEVVVPPTPTNVIVVPLSLVVEDGGSVLIARDVNGPYRERLTVTAIQEPFTAAVSTPGPPRYKVVWRTLAEYPQFFAIAAPQPTPLPLPK